MTLTAARVTRAADKRDAEEAFALSLEAFYPAGGLPEPVRKGWYCKWFGEPSFSPGDILLIRDDRGNLTGGLRMVSRTMQRGAQDFKVLGIAETFIKPACQGRGYTKPLMQTFLTEAVAGAADLAMVIARKTIDWFYDRYHFYGVGAYQRIELGDLDTRPFEGWRLERVRPFDTAMAQEAYKTAYRQCLGPMKRSTADWRFLVERCDLGTHEIFTVYTAGEPAGYCIINQGAVIELALLPGISYRKCVRAIGAGPGQMSPEGRLVLHLPATHDLLNADLGCDVRISTRECRYGGHLARILNPARMAALAEKRLQQEFRAMHMGAFDARVDRIALSWDGHRCRVAVPQAEHFTYGETRFLIGSDLICGRQHLHPVIRRLPLVISPLDEF